MRDRILFFILCLLYILIVNSGVQTIRDAKWSEGDLVMVTIQGTTTSQNKTQFVGSYVLLGRDGRANNRTRFCYLTSDKLSKLPRLSPTKYFVVVLKSGLCVNPNVVRSHEQQTRQILNQNTKFIFIPSLIIAFYFLRFVFKYD